MSALAKTQKKKAVEFAAQAEATLKKKAGWFSGSSKEQNAEDAAELYMQAANAYKVGGMQHEAGEAYVSAGGIYRDKVQNPNEAAKSFTQAGAYCD